MIEDHPQTTNVLNANGNFSLEFDSWFRKVKDQTNKGEIPPNIQAISANVGVLVRKKVTNLLIRVESATAGEVDITANPQIAPGFDGQIIRITGSDDVKKVKFDNGDGLKLAGSSSFITGNDDVLSLHFNSIKALWIENSRSNN